MSRIETIADGVMVQQGDCLELLAALPPCFRVEAVVTDPPFCVGFKYESHDDRPEAYDAHGGYGNWIWSRLELAESRCSPGAPIFVWQAAPNLKRFHEWFPRDWRLFCAAKNFVQMRPTPMQWSFDPIIVWWTPGAKGWSAGTATRDFHVANTAPIVATPNNIEKAHPCPRPLDQVEHIVEQWCRPGGAVLDPFMGSGTTGVAAVRLGRKFIGMEKEPKYFDIACRRLELALRQPDLFIASPEPVQAILTKSPALGLYEFPKIREEVGSVEGVFAHLSTYRNQPAIGIIDSRTKHVVWCVLSPELQAKFADKAEFEDFWKHSRVIVRGRLRYGPSRSLLYMIAEDISRIEPHAAPLEAMHDADFTGGLSAGEYLSRFRDGTLGG